MIYMNVGLLYEGDKDKRALIVLIDRVLKVYNSNLELKFLPFPADGPINSKVKAAYTEFFVNNSCGMAVFASDTDGSQTKQRSIINQVTKVNTSSKPIVVWCINPEFEQIFFDEENELKSVFGLQGSMPIPYEDMKPKERFKRLHDESPNIGITETVKDTTEKIAFEMDINMLINTKKCPSFKKLYKDIGQVIKLFPTN